ncbi:LysR family transcriptional regulator [Silvanigrella sp.]|jgi:DNA-binding transcriptional LysR family regulator|uniref:LysR family transcriptional regulator n=1 Tax=Silvanigrella sp. TaxID=2024976 RepID=UPI0037CADF03
MELDAIVVFTKVVETKSFSGAARLLKMPKTTVSFKIAALEKRLGVTLIQRTTRHLNITESGLVYYSHCVNAIKSIEQGESELLSRQDKPKGLLKITFPLGISSFILAQIISEYLKKYPDVTIELIVTNRIVDLIREGFDLAIRAGQLSDSTLRTKKFFDVHFSLWASHDFIEKNNKINHPSHLKSHSLIMHNSLNLKNFELIKGKERFLLNDESRVLSDDFQIIKELILLNNGIGLLPNHVLNNKNERDNLKYYLIGNLIQQVPFLLSFLLKNTLRLKLNLLLI